MRIFQNSGVMAPYRPRLATLTRGQTGFAGQLQVFLHDRYNASHILWPVYENNRDTFFTNGDDERLQRAWASEHAMPRSVTMAEILLAQIEHHGTEVFYNMDPVRFDAAFLKRLPGSVRRTIAWRAVPGNVDFTGYDLVVSNFPHILKGFETTAKRTALFFPSHDPALDAFAVSHDRPIDVLFIGGYSRHHRNRAILLERVAALAGPLKVMLRLANSRYTRLAESPLGLLGPLASSRRPKSIRAIALGPVFGREMYELLGQAKIVFNAAIDSSGPDRGNMRCYEAMGAAALLLTDQGRYPTGMVDRETMRIYHGPDDLAAIIGQTLADGSWANLAAAGHAMISRRYGKRAQFETFVSLAS